MSTDAHEAEYRQRLQDALGATFELRDLIGRGGFGAVYRAWDRKLERDVAVKALRHDLFPTPVVLERFQREAKALAQLRHAHILPVYSTGEGRGIAFMVMPLVRGETLGGVLRRGDRVPVADALRWIGEIARALDAAHRAGIVHRDVKPENILIEGPDRHAVLADFGIARATARESELTGTGVAIGSPYYMSPEQASADRELDGRSDIYSLGAVAYEMLAGRRPYDVDNVQRLLVLQVTTEPVPLASAAPAVPATVADAVMRALARDPADRWQTAGDFGSALAAAAAAQRVPPATTERESWFARRGLWLAALDLFGAYLSIAALVLLGGSERAPMVRTAVTLLLDPIRALLQIAILAFSIELVVTFARNRPSRTDGTWGPAWRAAFGQPRWWQPWYPRALRSPDSAWERMPASIKVLRTLLWLDLVAVPLALPLVFFVPKLADVAAGADMLLPLPARVMIATSNVVEGPLYIGAAVVAVGVVALATVRRVPALDVVKLLLTWRSQAWDSPTARRLSAGG